MGGSTHDTQRPTAPQFLLQKHWQPEASLCSPRASGGRRKTRSRQATPSQRRQSRRRARRFRRSALAYSACRSWGDSGCETASSMSSILSRLLCVRPMRKGRRKSGSRRRSRVQPDGSCARFSWRTWPALGEGLASEEHASNARVKNRNMSTR